MLTNFQATILAPKQTALSDWLKFLVSHFAAGSLIGSFTTRSVQFNLKNSENSAM